MTQHEAKQEARKMRAEGMKLKEIADVLNKRGYVGPMGRPLSYGTVGGWVPRRYRRKAKKEKKVTAHVLPPEPKSSSAAQKLQFMRSILSQTYLKPEDRIALALLAL